ncbi:AbrB family transcriptional regulator [Mesorhizobium sp. 1M-11]|uniref:AbrB family transcriptional regulator n=1 Tax=Mesorhizobium sp. 1M-11 TaxID=1529006 RepID=UPI0006C7400B|nr:AbrB family transcriptional regulator [Mesorhizobium sp. 1M-11]
MTINPESPSRFAVLAKPSQWMVLIPLTLVLIVLLELIHLPAALLIGSLVAGIVAGVNGATVRVPRMAFAGAQAIIGCLIAGSISLGIFSTLAEGWLLVLGVVVATLAASSLLGWLISRLDILPGTTGVWGSAPGASTAMVLMAGAFGADQRLVAFMQYLRVVIVTIAAAAVARLWVDKSGVAEPAIPWFPPLDWLAFGITLVVAAVGGFSGRIGRLPSPYFLGAFILGSIVHLALGLTMQIPEWLLAVSYVAIGWTIGLNFTIHTVRHAARALPPIIAAILVLMGFCGLMAWLIVMMFDVDPLTAYLATSPGGMDSVAIIAAASDRVDLSFVMALQAARFLVVLLAGPSVSRLVARTLR